MTATSEWSQPRQVRGGGAPRTEKIMIVESRAVGPFFKNGFVVGCEDTRDAVLIDPGDEVDGLLAFAARNALSIRHILLTHAHVDHVTGVAAAKRALGVPIYLHRDDLFLYERAVETGAMFGLTVEPQPPIDVFYSPGQVIPFGALDARPHHTPGHCPGGVCLQIGRTGVAGRDLFVGDTLFAGAIGRTDLPGGDLQTLITSIRTVLFAFGDDAIVHPGHGPDTTIGEERRTNPFLNRA
jgi:hydroxyacylglutathione hydrolase